MPPVLNVEKFTLRRPGSAEDGMSELSAMSDEDHRDLLSLQVLTNGVGDDGRPRGRSIRRQPEWQTIEITTKLNIVDWAEDSVKTAIKEYKDSQDVTWYSKGTIRSLCPECDIGHEARHRVLVLRYRCAHNHCNPERCTLETKFMYCAASHRVFCSTAGSHNIEGAAGGAHRRGITLRVKRFIASLVDQGKSPSTIASEIRSMFGESSPSLRQVQNFVFRFKRKAAKTPLSRSASATDVAAVSAAGDATQPAALPVAVDIPAVRPLPSGVGPNGSPAVSIPKLMHTGSSGPV